MSITYKRAAEVLGMAVTFNGCGRTTSDEMKEAVRVAQDALNKATPTMVTHNATKPEDCTCPNCGNVVSEFTTSFGQRFRVTCDYCRICGQALKWEGS